VRQDTLGGDKVRAKVDVVVDVVSVPARRLRDHGVVVIEVHADEV
jgi:hypothetical protein